MGLRCWEEEAGEDGGARVARMMARERDSLMSQ